jgi:hypothetical protein
MTEPFGSVRPVLASERRELFLAATLYWLGMAGREPTWRQAVPSSNPRYPAEDFLRVLDEKSTISGCTSQLRWSLNAALQSHWRKRDGSYPQDP